MSGQTRSIPPRDQERGEIKQAPEASKQHEAGQEGSGSSVETEPPQAEKPLNAQAPDIDEKSDDDEEMLDDDEISDDDEEEPVDFVTKHSFAFRVGHILLGIILAIWPYIFVIQVWTLHRQGGLQASDTLATLVQKHPHSVDFFITAIVVVISAMMTYLFTTALMCLYRDFDKPQRGTLFVLVYRSIRTDPGEWPLWRMFRLVVDKHWTGWGVVAIMALFSTIFTFLSPGLNGLLIPHPFYRIAPLRGYELDFSTSNVSCTEWIINNPIPQACNWMVHNGFQFTNCLDENQLVDVLESSRSSMRALSGNNNDTVTFIQLGGISFLGPIHGVFPIGPNGIQAFNTLEPLPGDPLKTALSYNYTVDLQGVQSNVSCRYDSSTPIVAGPFRGDAFVLNFTASCPTGVDVPAFAPIYFEPHFLNQTLAGWPCKTSETSYVIYLYGTGNYLDIVGNMTCTVAPLQHSLFDVTYTSKENLFVSQNVTGTSSNSSTSLLDNSISAIPYAISEAQNLVANMVAESTITYAVKYFGLNDSTAYVRDDRYLRLYEALIRGILEYQATYTRMVYSSFSPPDACRRLVAGTMSYEVIGWEAITMTGAYLIPLTIVNLSSIIMLLISLSKDPNGKMPFIGLGRDAEKGMDDMKDALMEQVADIL